MAPLHVLRRPIVLLIVTVAVLGAGSACSDGRAAQTTSESAAGPRSHVNGTYTATVTGALKMESSGAAQFTDPRDSDAPGWQFTVEMTEPAPVTWQGKSYLLKVFVANRQLDGMPEAGTFDVVSYFSPGSPDTYNAELSLSPPAGGEGYVRFQAMEGEITVRSVSEERIEGTVEFTGERPETGSTATVNATFQAVLSEPTIN
jgi:hypothetical protein